MADQPSGFYLDAVRALRGAPRVSSPFSHPSSIKAERVRTISTNDARPVYGSVDPDAALAAKGCRLTVWQITGQTANGLEIYTVHEALGTREEQDLWNERPKTYPYGSEDYPRISRHYRFFADDLPTFIIGSTADTVYPLATLLSAPQTDESAVVATIDAIFDDIPTEAEQAALGNGGEGLGITVAFPEGNKDYPEVTWRFRVLNGNYTPATDNEACPLPGYTALVLVDQGRTPVDTDPLVAIQMGVYRRLPGSIITSTDAKRLPRTLTAVPGKFLNGDVLATIKQVVAYGTVADTLTSTLLSSQVDAVTSLMATKTNVTRTDAPLPRVVCAKGSGELRRCKGSGVSTDGRGHRPSHARCCH